MFLLTRSRCLTCLSEVPRICYELSSNLTCPVSHCISLHLIANYTSHFSPNVPCAFLPSCGLWSHLMKPSPHPTDRLVHHLWLGLFQRSSRCSKRTPRKAATGGSPSLFLTVGARRPHMWWFQSYLRLGTTRGGEKEEDYFKGWKFKGDECLLVVGCDLTEGTTVFKDR